MCSPAERRQGLGGHTGEVSLQNHVERFLHPYSLYEFKIEGCTFYNLNKNTHQTVDGFSKVGGSGVKNGREGITKQEGKGAGAQVNMQTRAGGEGF